MFATFAKRIAEKQAQGADVINMGIGSPDLPPPEPIVAALCQSAQRSDLHSYAGTYGLPGLHEAIAGWYQRRFAVELDPAREVVPLIGSKEGIALIAMALVDPGDIALVPDPGYPPYRMGLALASGEIYPVPLQPEQDYLPALDAIPGEVLSRAKLLWLNYPNNPTGATTSLDFFAQVVAFALEHDIVICHDNPYCDITYDGYVAPSFLEVPGAKEVGIEFNSLSKTYNMAGWRVGMAVGNAAVLEALFRVKSNLDTGTFIPIQHAAIAALTGDQGWIADRNRIYRRRQNLVVEGLRRIGLEVNQPQATLYLWPRVPEGYTSLEFAYKVLDEAGVWFTPGTTFGQRGEGHMRISITTPDERLEEAIERLAKVVA